MAQIISKNLPTDPADIEQDAQDFFDKDIQTLVESIIVIGQLDPTEVDLTTGLPRWTPAQMELILGANSLLREWQD